jgi:hypothetical protein
MQLQLARSYLDDPKQQMVPLRIVSMPQAEGIQFLLSDFFDLMQGITNY